VRALRGRRRVSALADPRLRRAGLVALIVVVLDQATKTIVQSSMRLHQSIPLGPFVDLVYLRNPGAAFSLLRDAPAVFRLPLFMVVTVVVAGALVAYLRSTPPEQVWIITALGAILGGALGNLICRVRYGEVIDFVFLHWGDWYWPAFNVADSAITVGAVVVLVTSFRRDE
jgi:signal peptidase II